MGDGKQNLPDPIRGANRDYDAQSESGSGTRFQHVYDDLVDDPNVYANSRIAPGVEPHHDLDAMTPAEAMRETKRILDSFAKAAR